MIGKLSLINTQERVFHTSQRRSRSIRFKNPDLILLQHCNTRKRLTHQVLIFVGRWSAVNLCCRCFISLHYISLALTSLVYFKMQFKKSKRERESEIFPPQFFYCLTAYTTMLPPGQKQDNNTNLLKFHYLKF